MSCCLLTYCTFPNSLVQFNRLDPSLYESALYTALAFSISLCPRLSSLGSCFPFDIAGLTDGRFRRDHRDRSVGTTLDHTKGLNQKLNLNGALTLMHNVMSIWRFPFWKMENWSYFFCYSYNLACFS